MMWFRRNRRKSAAEQREAKLLDQIDDLEADLKAIDRIVRVKDAEIESLAAVIARDRERVLAESATFARQRAEQEGSKNG